VHRLGAGWWGQVGQRKKRAGGQGGGRSGRANDAALDQVVPATASALGSIKQQAMISAVRLVGCEGGAVAIAAISSEVASGACSTSGTEAERERRS